MHTKFSHLILTLGFLYEGSSFIHRKLRFRWVTHLLFCQPFIFNRFIWVLLAISGSADNTFLFFFLGLYLRHMEVSRLGIESELQLLAYTTTRAMPDWGCFYELHYSLRQCQIFNPLREARDRTQILMDTSWIPNLLSHSGNSKPWCYSCVQIEGVAWALEPDRPGFES